MSDPCPPGQRNDLFIISQDGGLDISPPCDCYVALGVSILDMVPFGIIMRKLGKFEFIAKYLTKLLKEGNSKWIRACELVGGKLTEVGAEGANLIKKSRDEVLEYFGSLGKKSIRDMYKLGPRINYYRTPGGKSFTNTLPDVTYTEVGAKARGINSSATIGSTDKVGSLYNTNTLASNIDTILTEADRAIQGAANAFQDQQTLDTLIRQFSNGSLSFPVAPGPKKITFNFGVGSHNSPYVGPRSIEIDVDSFLGSFDMIQEDLFNILPTKRSSMKSVKFDSAFNENLWDAGLGDAIVNKIQQDFPGIDVANQTDVLFSSKADFLGTGTAPTPNKAGFLGNLFSRQARSNKDEMYHVLDVMIDEEVEAAKKASAEFVTLKNDYNYSIRKLESTVTNGKEAERLGMVKEALEDANSSLSQKVGWAAQCFFHVFGRAINGIGRKKICLGDTLGFDNGARLNYDNCNCECPFGQETCSADYQLNPFWGTPMWIWDNMIPVPFTTAEMSTCFPACCEGQVAYKSLITQSCGCECYGDLNLGLVEPLESGSSESHFKGASGCDCLSKGWTGFGAARGKCVTDTETTTALVLEKAWDDARCEYNCAETRGLPGKLGASPDCPLPGIQNSYSVFKIGSACECECSQAAYNHYNPSSPAGTWPPTCPDGEWNGDANICACVNTGACAAKHQTNGGGEGGVSDNPCGGGSDCYNNKTQQECDAIAAEQGRTFTLHIGESCTGCCNEYFFSGVAASVSTSSGCDTSTGGYGGVFSQKCCWDGGNNPDDFTCCGDPQCYLDYKDGCDECGQPDC